jgi:hypothetical protein
MNKKLYLVRVAQLVTIMKIIGGAGVWISDSSFLHIYSVGLTIRLLDKKKIICQLLVYYKENHLTKKKNKISLFISIILLKKIV